jgi:hypothetical protein
MLRRLRAILVVLLVAATGWLLLRQRGRQAAPAAGGPAAGVSAVWVVDDGVRLMGHTPPVASCGIWDGSAIRLRGLRNEVVAWQVALQSPGGIAGVRVELGPLISDAGRGITGGQIERFAAHWLEVTAGSQASAEEPVAHRMGTGWFPCQLLPLTAGEVVDAPAGRNAVVWYDVHIPEDAQPGLYTGRLTVDGGVLSAAWDVHLEVLDATMPRQTHFKNWFYYGPEQLKEFYQIEDEGTLLGVEQQFIELAHDHRMNLATEPTASNGEHNWGAWWARYGPYLDGSAFDSGPCAETGASCWPIAADRDAAEADFKAACRSIVAFCKSRGLLDKVFYFAWDEPNDAAAYREIRRIGRWVDEAVGDALPVMVTESPVPQEADWGSLVGSVDIFCAMPDDERQIGLAKQRGDSVWVYNGGPAGGPYIDCPTLGVTAWGPAAWRFGIDGWFMWDATYWRQKHYGLTKATDLYADPLTFDETKRVRDDGTPYPADWALRLNGDGVFVYPGDPAGVPGPVASLRMKAFRRGAQDYEYLWLLKQAGHGQAADAFSRRMSLGRGEYEQNPDVWQQIRSEMANLLVGAGQ